MIDQRRTVARRRRAALRTLWDPGVPGVTPQADDLYLVVDEQDAGTIVVLAARWPRLDALGRLRFSDRTPVAASVSEEALEHAAAGATSAAPRPLRIGDVFLLRGLSARSDAQLARALTERDPSAWGELVDVTGPARDAAKAALFAAAAPRLSELHAEKLGLVEETARTVSAEAEAPPPSAPAAGPVV